MRFLGIILCLVTTLLTFADYTNIQELKELNSLTENKQKIDAEKLKTIEDLKYTLSQQNDWQKKVEFMNAIGREYTIFMSDSAVYYYNKSLTICRENGDSTAAYNVILEKIRPETISGYFAEALADFHAIDTLLLDIKLKPKYFECGYRLYSFALNATENGNPYFEKYKAKTDKYRRLWINSLPIGSITRDLYEAEELFTKGKKDKAKIILRELLTKLDKKSNEYAITAAIIANIYHSEGHLEECIRYYAQSAIADIRCSVKENQSIYELAILLYNLGEIDSAYKYILAAIEDAAFCNAQVRVYNASRMLPVIEDAHQKELRSHERMLIGYMLMVSLLVLGLVLAVFFLIKQMHKLSNARKKLHDANATKDEYMGQFLELCSVYMKRLDSFNKMVNRKLSLGQVDDLIKMTKYSRFSDEQHREFYQAFDLAFLKIYTTFIDDVNQLLRPEERYNIETPGSLNTELRIYALIRLGIFDSTKIAEFLKYSVNTIYTYRNKIKNKAIDRANFEENIMKIGVIE